MIIAIRVILMCYNTYKSNVVKYFIVFLEVSTHNKDVVSCNCLYQIFISPCCLSQGLSKIFYVHVKEVKGLA